MRNITLSLRTAVLLLFVATTAARADDRTTIFPGGAQLAQFLDALDVEHRWLAHTRVDWETGDATEPSDDPAHSTHCSAFVAAVCKRLDVPILHPPDHPQKLLANAQLDWLKGQGPENGWRQLDNAADAQNLANRGQLVVAAFKNPDEKRPGHIVIVRPAAKTADQIVAEGPDIIQAGAHNYRRTTVRQGFGSHPMAFETGQILYFAHRIVEVPKASPSPSPSPAS